jgi:hypothetical protein
MKNKTTFFAILAAILIIAAAWAAIVLTKGDTAAEGGPQDSSKADAAVETYVYDRTGFALDIPSGFSARLSDGEETDIVIVEGIESSSEGYQVAITPWDEPADALSFARIQADLPDLKLSRTQAGALPIGVLALSFEIEQAGEETREVWFVHAGYLYQMSAPIASAELIEDALEDMSFRK